MALIFRGQSYAQLGDYARAKADFQKAHNLPYPEGVAWKHIPNMRVFALQYLKKLAVDFDMPFDQEGDS